MPQINEKRHRKGRSSDCNFNIPFLSATNYDFSSGNPHDEQMENWSKIFIQPHTFVVLSIYDNGAAPREANSFCKTSKHSRGRKRADREQRKKKRNRKKRTTPREQGDGGWGGETEETERKYGKKEILKIATLKRACTPEGIRDLRWELTEDTRA